MSVVQKARMYHMNSAPQSLGVLKHINVKKIIKQKSLEQLQQLTNTCERFSINSNWYAKQTLQNKIKYLQAYQFSLYYSKNLKNIYHQKQKQLQQKRDLLKRNVDQKKKQIKTHKKKVQQMKHDYRDMKINSVKKVYNQYEDKLFALRRQQDQLHEMNVRMQQQMERAKYEIGPQFYQPPAYNNIPRGVIVNQNSNINGPNIKNVLQDNLRPVFNSNFQNQRQGSGISIQTFNNMNNPPFSSPIQNPSLQVSKKGSKGQTQGIKNQPLNKNNSNNKNDRINRVNQQVNYFDLQQQSNHNIAPQQMNSIIRLRVSSQSNQQYGFKDSKKQIIRSTQKKDSLVLIDQYNQEEEKEKQSMMYSPTIKINNKNLLTKNMKQEPYNQDGSQSFGQLNQNSKHSINASFQKKQEDQFTKKRSILKQTQKTKKLNANIRLTAQSYQQQQKDTVAQLDNGISNNKNSPISLPKSSSIIKKGDDSNIFKGDNSFFDIKLNLDSKISNNDQKSSLMQSKSRISDSDQSNKTYSFNLKNQKKKSSIQSDPRQSQNLNSQDLIQSKKLKQAESLRLSQIEIDDRNLYSSNKGTEDHAFKSRLAFNKPPKRKNVSDLNLKLSEVSNAQQKEELIQTLKNAKEQKQQNQSENDEKYDDDFDQAGFGLGQKSVISKKKQKPKVSQIVIGKNNLEQNRKKQVLDKIEQKISVKAPPQLPKQRYDDENQYGQDFQDQQKPNHNNQPIKNILQQNSSKQQQKKNTIESRQRSKVDISISPNHSYADVIKQQSQFAELEDQTFKLKAQNEYINRSFNPKQKDIKDNEKKGIITSVLKSLSVKNSYIQSKVNMQYLNTQSDIDFLEDFDMPMHSVIGKKPVNIRNSNINSSNKQQSSKISIRVVGNDGNVVSSQQVPKSLKDLLGLQRKKTQPQKKEDQEDYQGQQFEQLPEILQSNTGEQKQSQNVKQKMVNKKDNNTINPISVQMIQSKTFQFGKDWEKQPKPNKLGLDNQSLFLPMTKSVLESKNSTIGINQKQVQGQVQEQIQFNLQDGSKVQQFQKQQLQKKIIRMIRNKNKLAQDKQSKSKQIQQKIIMNVQRQIQQITNKKMNKITDWKNVHDIFAKQIQQIKKKQTISQKKLDQQLSEINKKIKQQKQKASINNQQKELFDDQLNYSTSMIKNSFLNSNIKKTKTDQIKQNDDLDFSLKQKSRFQTNKIAQIKQQQGSSQLNNFGKEASSNKQSYNIKQTFKPQRQYNTIQSEQFGQQKSSRQNKLMGQKKSKTIEQQGKNYQTSKSKYAKVSKSVTPKNATKQTVISKIQQNKYTAMQDPLAKDISKASNLFNAKKSPSNQEDDDF